MSGNYQVRSISLPSRFHPTSVRIDQEINNLKSWEGCSVTSSNEVCSLLAGLEEAYGCADLLVNMQSGYDSLKNEEWVSDLFDGSVKILDVCSTLRETMLMIKGHVQAIQSALRRKKGDSIIQRNVSEYLSFRKHMTKNSSKMLTVLKQVNQVSTRNNLTKNSSKLIIKAVEDVTAVTISVFESLLTSLAASANGKANKWSLVYKLMNKKVVAQQDGVMDELASVDAFICKVSSSEELLTSNTQMLLERLEALEVGIGCIEARLECIFRRLVRLRVSLLNMVSS